MTTSGKIQVQPMGTHTGAIITGINSQLPVADDVAHQLRQNLLDHQLLIIKGKTLSPAEQINFSKAFGTLETFPYNNGQFKAYPEIFRLSTDQKKGYKNVGFYWHQDGSFNRLPTAISIFHLVEIPESGGATLFADAHRAYEFLLPEEQQLARLLKTRDRSGTVHDLVIDHPMTNKPSIYFNFGLTEQVFSSRQANKEQVRELLQRIHSILEREDIKYTHHWQKGDLVVVDNYAVFHQATPVLDQSTRTLHRTTIKGQHPLNRRE